MKKAWLKSAFLLFLTVALPFTGSGQGASESRAFGAAMRDFNVGIYPLAEKELSDFIRMFPQSAQLPEAILFQAQAALKQQKYKIAVELLRTNATLAGLLADQYRYYLGQAHLEGTNYQAAAAVFSSLIRDFPNSPRLLAASYGEAQARFKLRDFPRVIDLLQRPDGTFRKESVLRASDELAVRGALLLAEALLEQKAYPETETVLGHMSEADLTPEFKWRRQYLFCRAHLADRRLTEALAGTTNLLALATASGEQNFLSASIDFQGEVLEQLSEFDSAVQVYEQNLAEGVASERARHALLKLTELLLALNKPAEAAQKLETFLVRHPDDAASDVALVTMGELHLRQHLESLETNQTAAATNLVPVAATNHLEQALANFDRVITNYPQSALVGKAQLDKGWTLWVDGKIPQSQAAFKLAVDGLPHSDEQAIARFKLAEAQFFQKDYTNALLNFQLLITETADLPKAREQLAEQAFYQIVRASLRLGDLQAANEAMRKILESYPKSFFADRSLLLVGQRLNTLKKPADARLVFRELLDRFPDSPLVPQVELAIARTFFEEENWASAINKYEEWLERFGTNDLRPQAEFNRAWANDKAGRQTNALDLFTNFVARFPTDELAPRAQYWVGRYYYNQNDFPSAEKNFQHSILLQNTNFSYQAIMMAGRAAVARRAYFEAKRDYFEPLLNDPKCPEEIKAEAYFAEGDMLTLETPEPGKPLQKFAEAIVAFSKIPSLYPTNRLVPRAWGRIGDCYLQLGAADSKQYDEATNAFQKALVSATDVSARSKAEVGLARALEGMAELNSSESATLLDTALAHYTSVLFQKNLRDAEQPDPFWLKEAGLAAGRLAEKRKQWEMAINIYNEMTSMLPPVRELLKGRIDRAAKQWHGEKN